MIRSLLLICCFFITEISAFSQTTMNKVRDYVLQYKDIAMEEMVRTGVPAAITLAQGILESGCGQSVLAKSSNNHFGIKCKTEWTGPKTYHNDDSKNECFRVYENAEASYRDHSDFLKNRPYYTDLFHLNPSDYKGWAYGLKKDGYATEKDYPLNLIRIIETYHLEEFSDLVLNGKASTNDYYAKNNLNPVSSVQDTKTAKVNSSEIAIPLDETNQGQNNYNDLKEKQTSSRFSNDHDSAQDQGLKMRVAQTTVMLPAYPKSSFVINGTKVVYAPKGMSYLALASAYHIDYSRLQELNYLKTTEDISKGRLIYLQKRPKRGNKDFYICSYGETLNSIADKLGIQIKSLEEYNRTGADSRLVAGQKVYLRHKSRTQLETID